MSKPIILMSSWHLSLCLSVIPCKCHWLFIQIQLFWNLAHVFTVQICQTHLKMTHITFSNVSLCQLIIQILQLMEGIKIADWQPSLILITIKILQVIQYPEMPSLPNLLDFFRIFAFVSNLPNFSVNLPNLTHFYLSFELDKSSVISVIDLRMGIAMMSVFSCAVRKSDSSCATVGAIVSVTFVYFISDWTFLMDTPTTIRETTQRSSWSEPEGHNIHTKHN